MATLQLGYGAYERRYASEPPIRCENRFLEANPTNLREKTALLARPGTEPLAFFNGGRARRVFSKRGLFDTSLFVIAGENLWRYRQDGTRSQIVGIINGDGPTAIAWYKGIGVERLFIADGLLLQYYDGGTHASGVLESTGAITNQVVRIGAVYYTWGANVNVPGQNGTAANPWVALLGGTPALSLVSLVRLIMFAGTRGVDYSTALGGPSLTVTAAIDPVNTSKMIATAISEEADGNAIVTQVTSGTDLAWSAATLTGGGVHALHGVPMPDGKPAKSVATLAGFVLVSIARSQQFYFIRPGEKVIQPLDFASKEQAPDAIVDMVVVGDQVLLIGTATTETWYATGDNAAPLVPVKGRAYQRGMLEGTACVVNESVIFVGDDGIVYQVSKGINRISNHGVEERIRVLRLAEGDRDL